MGTPGQAQPPPYPQLPELVMVTGTSLSSGTLHIDARWGHFGADHWVEGRPTEEGQGAALDLSATRQGKEGQDGDGQPPTGKAGERFKVVCGYQPPRSFWIGPSSTPPDRSPAGSAVKTSNPRMPTSSKVESYPARRRGSSRGVERTRAWSAS